jgi:hypothetical protein
VIRCLTCFMAVLAAVSSAAAQPKKTETWFHKLARVLGVDRAPVNLKGSAVSDAGAIWVTPADHAEPRRVAEGNFRSPVFQPGTKYLFALRGGELVRVALADGAVSEVRELPGVLKLVGFDQGHPDQLLAVFSAAAQLVDVALVSVKTGKRQMIATRQSNGSQEVQSLLGWQRRYGEVVVLPQGRDIIVSGIEPDDRNVSDCGAAQCSQPSYSPELRQVAFIRSPRQ